MIIKYAIKQIRRRPVMNFLILFQFICIITLVLMISGRLNGYFVASNTIKNVCSENCYRIEYDTAYLSDIDDRLFELQNKFNEEIDEYAQKLENKEISKAEYDKLISEKNDEHNKIIKEENLQECFNAPNLSSAPYIKDSYFFSYTNLMSSNDENDVKIINEEYAEKLSMKMKDGVWLSDAKIEPDCINIVAFSGSGYSIGDTIDLKTQHTVENSIDSTYNDVDFYGKIVGIIDYSYYKNVIERNSFVTDDYLSFDDVLPVNMSTLLSIYSQNSANPLYNCKGLEINNFSQMLLLEDNINNEQMQEFSAFITENKCVMTSMKAAYHNTYMKDKKEFQNDIVFLSIASAIAIICLVGMSALSVVKEIKTYSIYCLCGMSKRECIYINVVYISFMIISSSLVAIMAKMIIAFNNYHNAFMVVSEYRGKNVASEFVKYSDYFTFGAREFVTILLILTLSFVCAMIIPCRTLRKMQPVSILKEI